MLAALYKKPFQIRCSDVQIPIPGPNEALIKVDYAGICGSDLMIYRGLHPMAKSGTIVGHEFTGRIVSLPKSAGDGLTVGDRVVAMPLIACKCCSACLADNYNICERLQLYGIHKDGGMAEYAAISVDGIKNVPRKIDGTVATLIEPLAVAVHAVRLSEINSDSNVFILGGGPIGYLIALLCKLMKAKVAVGEIDPYRLDCLQEANIPVVNTTEPAVCINYHRDLEMFDGEPIDAIFDAAGAQEGLEIATTIVKPKGKIIIVAFINDNISFDFSALYHKELCVMGSRTYLEHDFNQALEILASNLMDLSALTSYVLPLTNVAEGFEVLNNKGQALKVLIEI